MSSIFDVAARAGVSVKTVSRILGDYPGVSPETRRKVEAAMKDLEYYPSAAARHLRGESSGIVSLIADNLTTTPDAYEIVAGIQSECEAAGKLLMIGETGGKASSFNSLVERFRQQRTEAMIYATMFHREVVIGQSFKHCPLVLLNCVDANGEHPAIIPDDRAGAFAATEALLKAGHRRIAYLTLFKDMRATTLRTEGYCEALKKHGLEADPDLIVPGVKTGSADEFVELPEVLKRLLEMKSRPTALFCGNDKMAMRVYMLVRRMGFRIPEDLSVVGYDNYKLIAENLVPQLTTVSLSYFGMGAAAAKLVLTGKAKGTGKGKVRRIPGELLIRGSVAPPSIG
jgi:LacI family transcriptional regulator